MTNSRRPRSVQTLGLLAWLLLTFAAGATGAVASATAATFYQQLLRPVWAPPGWLFGPVWTLLYCMIGVAAWLVWRAHGLRSARSAFLLFVSQLVANALWTWLFFTLHRGGLAFAEILLLWLLIVANVVAFWRLHRLAAMLLVPYLLWVSFASVLTLSVWRLNPGLLV